MNDFHNAIIASNLETAVASLTAAFDVLNKSRDPNNGELIAIAKGISGAIADVDAIQHKFKHFTHGELPPF